MELIEGSGVFVNASDVEHMQSMYKKNPREMTRKLMKLILGEETLKQSSATGRNGWTPIPENVFRAVKRKQMKTDNQ